MFYLYILTLLIVIMNVVKLVTIMVGNSISFPTMFGRLEVSITHYVIFYPSLFFQLAFYADKFGWYS